jgi:hypothetical protein
MGVHSCLDQFMFAVCNVSTVALSAGTLNGPLLRVELCACADCAVHVPAVPCCMGAPASQWVSQQHLFEASSYHHLQYHLPLLLCADLLKCVWVGRHVLRSHD